MHKPSHHKTDVHDLPAELIPEIASYLDPKDILSLEQTDKKLRNSINVRSFWLTLAKTYSARHFHVYQPQSGWFDDLTEHQLRRWIRKRLHFDRIWKAPLLQPRLRTLTEPPDGIPVLKLVPGGRWLLAGGQRGVVWYCDLDSEGLEWNTLIGPSEAIEGSDRRVSVLKTYADLDASGLEFSLAIMTEDELQIPPAAEWLHVWQVKVKDGVTAKWLNSFQIPGDTRWPFPLAFPLVLGPHVVVCARELASYTAIEIYWWKQCSTTGHLRSHFLVPLSPDVAYLIGDDKILYVDITGGVNLYNIPEPEYISIKQNLESYEDLPSPEPTWSYAFQYSTGLYYSPLYHDGATYRFTASMTTGIWGFTIPTKEAHTPSAIRLSTFFDRRSLCIPGLYKSFAPNHKDESGIRIGYDWESNVDGNATVTYTIGELTSTSILSQPTFDEESGRFLHYCAGQVNILDFLDPDTKYKSEI